MLVVDRIEGNIVIVENDNDNDNDNDFLELPISLFPLEISEGDVIKIDIVVDKEETEKRRKNTSEKLKNLFNRWK